MTPELQDALAKLDAMPMLAMHLTNAARVSITPEDEAADPMLRPILEKAIADFKRRLDNNEPTGCMLCGIDWSMKTPNRVKCHGLAVVCEAVEFRRGKTINDRSPMLVFGLCELCTADLSTLRPRVLEGLKQIWPTLRSMPASQMPPMSSRPN